jgi:methyl-accepting chemotaxis protein
VTILAFLVAIVLGIFLGTSISGSLKKSVSVLDKMAAGDLSERLVVKSKDEFALVAASLGKVGDSVNLLVTDAGLLAKAAVEGKLATRADATKHRGDFRKVVEGVNKTLDSVIGPLNVAANYVDRISKGDIPPKITDAYQGDFNEIKNNLNQAIDAVNALVADSGILVNAAVDGKLATRADATRHQGDYRRIVEGVNKTLDSVIGPLNVAANYVDRISKGDIPPKITDAYKGDFNEIKNNLNQAIDAVNALVADAGILSKAAVEGKLATRADASNHQGDFRKIVDGVNKTLDSVIGPLNVAANYVDRISKGDIPPKITDAYHGDFNEIKNNLNQAIDAVNALVADAGVLAQAAVDGKLATRADPTRHQGDYRKIVDGVNRTLDSVIGPLNVAANYVDRISKGDIPPKITDTYNGDFNEIKNNLNQAIDAVNALAADAGMLARAAVDGKLATRADATKHQGDFRKIVDGVNKTLDAVIGPLNVAAAYVDKISGGNIPSKITDTYNGDFNEIKNNLNKAIDAVNGLVADAGMLVQAAIDGKLATRADVSKHQGDYRKIVDGVNKTLDAVIGPLNVAAEYVDKISAGDIPPKITDSYNGDFNTIKNNLNKAIDAVNSLVADAGMLVQAAIDGKLQTRADATKHRGDYRKIVDGVNKTLDAVIGPLNVAADYVDKISSGNMPPKISDTYNGDFNTIKNNLNQAIDAVNGLVADATMLVEAAVEGRLQTRADAAKHQGDYRKIVDGVNRTLDLVITPINETNAVLKRMAEGDLTGRITSDYKGDFDVLKTSLNDSLGSLNDILGQVNTAVDQVAEGSGQVSQASQSLSQGATEQASSLEEITSSITELSSQTKTNTQSAIQVNGLANTAKENAERGNEQMKDLVKAMSAINTSAEEIKKVTKAIDDISFQINLLALNANVEAARAGKYGKGFAVVAEEVRNLAVRSANSVKETTRMVDEAIANIERGNNMVGATAQQLAEIVGGAGQVATLAEEVSRASKEQSLGLEQVSQGLGQIDQVTQSNTASAEESASASEELSSQSQQVKSMLSRFKLSARESRMSDADVVKMMRAEMARQQGGSRKPALVASKQAGTSSRGINPASLISLDDADFGKF